MTSILGIDPGHTTGFFIYSPIGVDHFQLDPDAVFEHMHNCWDYDAFVVEKFRPKGTSDPLPAEINGAVRLRSRQVGAEFVEVSPSQAKTMAPDDLLKELGWFNPELPHANDAARLVVHYAVTKLPHGDYLHEHVVNTKLAGRL